jgi:iron complex transport system ATP-binding protein
MTTAGGTVFSASELVYAYPGTARAVIDHLTTRIRAGAFHGILGPNGSGKSTLVKLLLGVAPAAAGGVEFLGRPLRAWSRRELALRIGVVPQAEEVTFPLTVRELVAFGRYPHLGAWRPEGSDDRRAIFDALDRCSVLELADRPLATLSGGERQRARIARALAQRPGVLILDEPTAALDLRHEMGIFELMAGLAREGVTVVLVTHNLNLAARYADEILLLNHGRAVVEGPPRSALTGPVLERVFGWPVTVLSHPGPGPDAGAPQFVPLAEPRTGGTA